MLQLDACILYYTGQDPDSLSDDDWARLAKMIEWVREEEKKNSLKPLV